MAAPIRIPITNQVNHDTFTLKLSVGEDAVPINVLLDTGSSMLAVSGDLYKPNEDSKAATTNLLQTQAFRSGVMVGAAMRTSVGLMSDATTVAVTVANANLAVVYDLTPSLFSQADGILGLAYPALNKALKMPDNTSKIHYKADQLAQAQPTANLTPYFDQLAAANRISNKFAFAVRRSVASQAMIDPSDDPLNQGLWVLGNAEECTDLYTGAFSTVAVVHQQYYNTNLMAIQVGNQSIDVAPVAASAAVGSNSIIDSGNSVLALDQAVYDRVIGLFNTVNPNFAGLLKKYSPNGAGGIQQANLKLTDWPLMRLLLQGRDGRPVNITVKPENYWQFDFYQKGLARSALCGDGGSLHGQSALGLPLFAGHYVVFDRGGQGSIGFADLKQPAAVLVS